MKRYLARNTSAILCISILTAHAAHAVVVTSTSDSGAGSLRAVIAAAAPNDTVTFSVVGS